jgi:hypothetical protein
MRGVADQGHAGDAIPAVADRKRVERAWDRGRFALGDQGVSSGAHPANSAATQAVAAAGSAKSISGDPFGGAVERDISMEDIASLAVGEDALSRSEREQGAAARGTGRRWDAAHRRREGRSRRRWCRYTAGWRPTAEDGPSTRRRRRRRGDRWSTVDPSAKRERVAAIAERRDSGEPPSPADRACGQRFDQDAAQIAAQHLWASAGAVVGHVEQHRAVPVEDAGGFAALVDDRAELFGEAGGGECRLTVLFVDVELATLGAGMRRGVGLVDRRGDAMDMEDASQDEAAKARAYYRYWCHSVVPCPLTADRWGGFVDILV